MKEKTIIKLISNPDLFQYQEERDKFIEGKEVVSLIEGVLIPITAPGGQMAFMNIPYAFIEYKVTTEEFNNWRLSNKFKI